MIFTQSDLIRDINDDIYTQGLKMFQQGKIVSPNVQQGGKLITAVIKQSASNPIRVYVRTDDSSDTISINGECSCGPSPNCQHVVAVMLQALKDNQALENDIKAEMSAAETTQNEAPPQNIQTARVNNQATRPGEQVLLYFLHLDRDCQMIETVTARTKSLNPNSSLVSGSLEDHFTLGQYYNPTNISQGHTARFLSDGDQYILKALNRQPRHAAEHFPVLAGKNSRSLLQKIIGTARCFLHKNKLIKKNVKALSWGTALSANYEWKTDQYGSQNLHLQIDNNLFALQTSPEVCYLDIEKRHCGPLNINLSADVVNAIAEILPIQADQTDRANKYLQQNFPNTILPTLQTFQFKKLPRVTATQHLKLKTTSTQYFRKHEESNIANLSFDYAGLKFRVDDPPLYFDGSHILKIERDHKLEKLAVETLLDIGFEPDFDVSNQAAKNTYHLSHRQQDWVNFQCYEIPKLRQAGWKIDIDADFRQRVINPQQWFCNVRNSNKPDWFDIGIGIDIDGVNTNILPALLQCIREYPHGIPKNLLEKELFTLPLETGGLLAIPTQRMQNIFTSLLELYDNDSFSTDDTLQLNRLDLARLSAFDPNKEDTRLHWISDSETKILLDSLCHANVISEVVLPKKLKADLRDYQHRGLNWLQFLSRFKLAGILADDMGLGKTVQALAHLLLEKELGRANRPSLVIAPTSLMFNWRQEAKKFAPSLKVLTLWGPNRHAHYAEINKFDLVLTTYPLVVRDTEKLLQQSFHLLILDEAQVIKNSKTKASREIRKIEAKQRLCLTGTPLENHLGELWSLFDFLLPGLLGSNKQFQRFFRTPIESEGDSEASDRLRRRIRPFLLRRTKQQVAKELPAKTVIIQTVSFDTQQRELYETVRLAMYQLVKKEIQAQGISRSHIIVLDALLKLRQVCCDPRLVNTDAAKNVTESAKLEVLLQFVQELVDEGRRILIFSQFTKMLAIIEVELQSVNIAYVKLTGQTRDRQAVVEKFQSKQVPVFLISLKAGGVGLNLTAADTVIHYDPWWNPAAENQATDRAHRIGQKNPVFVYKFICQNTVEEKIHQMQKQKQALADNLYDGSNGQLPKWTPQDLAHLFSPIGD